MGPPLDGGGWTAGRARCHGSISRLQWGRRSMAADGALAVGCLLGSLHASMGPPLDGGGRSASTSRRAATTKSFNGAAARWRRKGCSSRSSAPRCARFNGAAARWRRKVRLIRDYDAGKVALQWGRRSMAAEGFFVALPKLLLDGASMGPPLDGGGRKLVRTTWERGLQASMGPPLAGGGRAPCARRSALCPAGFNGAAARWRRKAGGALTRALGQGQASMGPPLDGGGRSGWPRAAWLSRLRFNGAAARWRRKDSEGRAWCSPKTCFNGAAARWRRKERDTETRYGAQTGFNGAAARWRRKEADMRRVPAGHRGRLQWGRRSRAAEGVDPVARRDGGRHGFNGAAARWRRKDGVARLIDAAAAKLQWGRRSMAAEGAVSQNCPRDLRELQWGRRSMAAEGPRQHLQRHSQDRASMGPPLDGGGRLARRAL